MFDGMNPRTIRLSALGDSITAGNPGWDPDPVRRLSEGDDPQSQYLYWVAHADPRIDFRNHGVGGEVTEEILRRFPAAAESADVLAVQGGINDVVHELSVETAAANLRELVRRGKEFGLGVVLANVLPWNKGWPDADGPIRRLNNLIGAIGSEEDVLILPFYETLDDPDRPGRMREDWTLDGNHPSVEGYRRLGELAFRLPPGYAA